MQVRLQNTNLFVEPVLVKDIQTIVILDDSNLPIFVASRVSDRGIWTMSVDDPNFHETLKNLGIKSREAKVFQLEELAPKPN